MKLNNIFQSTAVSRAARGELSQQEATSRATTMYGFRNHALHLSGEELRDAWKNASSSIRKSRG
ncbi:MULTISPECIES: hypothetical protein [Pseudoalteromonas]|uniref:hypothetical protein n=1 Tax=Pseudoalteromonas TaxID=53246 RepID=UPI000F7AD139|nr:MULTISPECIES: hypothetical protein [Pseudoalteromonas]MCF2907002.1 hypothetical protein [Pseudoalteromonas sp. DL2-H2.2]